MLVAYGEVVAVSDTATDIVIPAGVTEIADYAFEGKDQVVTLSVAADFTLDLVDLAKRFPLLESITVESGNSNYLSDAGALYNAAGTELLFIPVKYPGPLVVREGVTALDSALFEGRTGITALTIPVSVSTIENGAFDSLIVLESITVNDQNSNYMSLSGVLYNRAGTELIFVPARVTSVDISATVTTIADGAFSTATALVAVNVDEANTVYSSTSGVLYNKAGTELLLVPVKYEGALNILDGVTELTVAMFDGRAGITELIVPASVTSVQKGVFGSLVALKTLTVPTVGATGAFCTWFGADAAAVPGTLTSVTVTGAVEAVDFAQFGADIEVTLNGLRGGHRSHP